MLSFASPSRTLLTLSLVAATACAPAGAPAALGGEPQRAVDDLLAADRTFAAAAARADGVDGVTAMFADDVWVPTGRGDFARSASDAAESLRAAVGESVARVEWIPIRGGISADAQHGFTFGYVTVHRRDTTPMPAKYLSYWVRRPAGWRVVAFKLARRPPGDVSLATMAPSVPARLRWANTDPVTVARYTESLVAAERAFSDRAQQIGLGPAFVEYGRPDAMNLGGRGNASFVVGNEAIGKLVSGGGPRNASPVSWSADRAIVASSGDLGVTFGFIRPNRPAPDAPPTRGTPFFTIWRRDRPTDPWRYIAE